MSDQILAIIESWRFPEQELLWSRQVEVPPPAPDLATIISGVRRCGKSTLLSQLAKRWKLPLDRCHVVNFEDPRLVDRLDTNLLDQIVESATAGRKDVEHYFFFDEIQVIANWQKWLRLQVDRPSSRYYIATGSNASLLSGELSTVLTGRHRSFELFPLSWSEFSSAFTNTNLNQYLMKGGFPRVLKDSDPGNLLRQYFADIVEKDIRERLGVRSASDLRRVFKAIFESTGSELSLRRLSSSLRFSVDTLSSYLEAAENAYLCFHCPYYSYSERQRAHRNKKYYVIDSAMRRAVITPTGADLGKDFENAVFLELRRKFKNVYYWKGTKEVDFVVEAKKGVIPIQVSWDGVKDRHEIGLDEFYKEFRNALDPVYVDAESFSKNQWIAD